MSQLRHYSKGVQWVPEAVYCIGCRPLRPEIQCVMLNFESDAT